MYKIIYLTDSYDCETCGCNYAEGYQIYKTDELVVDKSPVAHCYDGINFDHSNAPFDILELERIKVETTSDIIGGYEDHED